jgi:hypothetical protein
MVPAVDVQLAGRRALTGEDPLAAALERLPPAPPPDDVPATVRTTAMACSPQPGQPGALACRAA